MRAGYAVPAFAALISLGGGGIAPAAAGNRFAVVPHDFESTPAYRYAALSSGDCESEIQRRALPVEKGPQSHGVDAPMRITDALHGVSFIHVNAARGSAGNIVDCRLVLAIDDFAAMLAHRSIDQVGFISAYRRAEGTVAAGQRHPAALAMDVAWFRRSDGTMLDVQRDFGGHVGRGTCGKHASPPAQPSPQTVELREVLCDAADARLFNLLLTPNYDALHRDHVHLEVRRDIRWFLVQ